MLRNRKPKSSKRTGSPAQNGLGYYVIKSSISDEINTPDGSNYDGLATLTRDSGPTNSVPVNVVTSFNGSVIFLDDTQTHDVRNLQKRDTIVSILNQLTLDEVLRQSYTQTWANLLARKLAESAMEFDAFPCNVMADPEHIEHRSFKQIHVFTENGVVRIFTAADVFANAITEIKNKPIGAVYQWLEYTQSNQAGPNPVKVVSIAVANQKVAQSLQKFDPDMRKYPRNEDTIAFFDAAGQIIKELNLLLQGFTINLKETDNLKETEGQNINELVNKLTDAQKIQVKEALKDVSKIYYLEITEQQRYQYLKQLETRVKSILDILDDTQKPVLTKYYNDLKGSLDKTPIAKSYRDCQVELKSKIKSNSLPKEPSRWQRFKNLLRRRDSEYTKLAKNIDTISKLPASEIILSTDELSAISGHYSQKSKGSKNSVIRSAVSAITALIAPAKPDVQEKQKTSVQQKQKAASPVSSIPAVRAELSMLQVESSGEVRKTSYGMRLHNAITGEVESRNPEKRRAFFADLDKVPATISVLEQRALMDLAYPSYNTAKHVDKKLQSNVRKYLGEYYQKRVSQNEVSSNEHFALYCLFNQDLFKGQTYLKALEYFSTQSSEVDNIIIHRLPDVMPENQKVTIVSDLQLYRCIRDNNLSDESISENLRLASPCVVALYNSLQKTVTAEPGTSETLHTETMPFDYVGSIKNIIVSDNKASKIWILKNTDMLRSEMTVGSKLTSETLLAIIAIIQAPIDKNNTDLLKASAKTFLSVYFQVEKPINGSENTTINAMMLQLRMEYLLDHKARIGSLSKQEAEKIVEYAFTSNNAHAIAFLKEYENSHKENDSLFNNRCILNKFLCKLKTDDSNDAFELFKGANFKLALHNNLKTDEIIRAFSDIEFTFKAVKGQLVQLVLKSKLHQNEFTLSKDDEKLFNEVCLHAKEKGINLKYSTEDGLALPADLIAQVEANGFGHFAKYLSTLGNKPVSSASKANSDVSESSSELKSISSHPNALAIK